MNDSTDHAAIVYSLLASNIGWQMRFNPPPLLIAQPKQVPAHDPIPPKKRIKTAYGQSEKLMSSDPR